MKVLFLVQHLSGGGAERTVSYLSGYLSKNGFDTCVLSVSNEKFYELDDSVKYVTLNIPMGEKNVFDKIAKAVKRTVSVNRYISKEKPDLVFCMLYTEAKYITVKRNKRYKLIVSERNNPDIVKSKKAIKMRNRVFSLSDGMIFQTLRAKNYFSEEFRKKGVVIPNAIGNDLVYKVPEIKERTAKICAMGRLHKQKNYPLLLNAFKEVLERHPEYNLDIYGSGAELENLIELTKSLGIADNVNFKGVKPNAIIEIADAACYVLCSSYEGMPNALMEAMAVGLPCVATDCPNGPAELIQNGENGILIPNNDEKALVEAILKMIEDKSFAERCGACAKNILNTHGLETNAQLYLEYIKNVATERKCQDGE